MTLAVAAIAVAAWVVLAVFRGSFWLGRERDDRAEPGSPTPSAWPSVTAIVPARDEAEVVGACVASLIGQDYPGALRIVLVDDGSTDGTAEIARAAAARAGGPGRLEVIRGGEPPAGWTGKLWAMRTGLAYVEAGRNPPAYVLFTDADIAWREPGALSALVRIALARGAVLASLMVRLRCDSAAERALVPAFIYFFQKLYPFAWVNDPRSRFAAAAGGAMLVRRTALAAGGGLETIRDALIDDCALGAALKRQGSIWLGLTERVESLRPYPAFADIRRMVARSAYAELRYSPLRLAGTLAGLAVAYLAPPLLAIFAEGPARWLGASAWALMAVTFVPTLRFYGRSPLWAAALPAIAAVYAAFTLDSAVQHWRGRGGAWKGRYQAAGRVVSSPLAGESIESTVSSSGKRSATRGPSAAYPWALGSGPSVTASNEWASSPHTNPPPQGGRELQS